MQRSWLAKAKSVHDLGGFEYIVKPGQTWDEARDDLATEKWLKKLRQPIPVAEKFLPFFGSRMHDSWVISIDCSPDTVRLSLDCINTDIFVLDLVAEVGIERVPSRWPVDLVLHEPVFMRTARYAPNGALRFEDYRSLGSPEPQKGDAFLHDWFFEEDDRIQWVAEIYSRRQQTHKLSSSVFLMVDCRRVSAVDHRADAIEKAYGPSARIVWNEVLHGNELMPPYEGIWGMNCMRDFINERMKLCGFRRSDFVM